MNPPAGLPGPEGAGGDTAPRERALPWGIIQAAGAVLVLTLFLWELEGLLNPLLLYAVLMAFLIPYRGHPHQPLLVAVASGLTFLWVLGSLGTLLAPFLVAMGLAYLLDPSVDRLEARGIGRTVAIAILAGPALVLLTVLGIFGIPALGDQVSTLISQTPVLIDRLTEWAASLEQMLERLPWVGASIGEMVNQLDPQVVTQALEERRAEIARRAWEGVLGVGRGLGSALTVVSYVILTPVLTFYLLRDWDGIVSRTADLVPRPQREAVGSFFQDFDDHLSRFLRGQILVATLMGFLTAAGLWVWGFPYAILVGVLVAVFSVIPYLGLILSLLPAVIIALTSGQAVYSLVKVGVVFGVVQGLEGTVISPRIVGESVGLHPVWVLLAIAAAGFFFGFVGLLLAVPAAVGVKLLTLRLVERYRDSATYRGSLDEAGDAA